MAVLLLLAVAPAAAAEGTDTPEDAGPTVILMLAPERDQENDSVTLRARVRDPDGLVGVTLRVRGDAESGYTARAMQREPDGTWAAHLPVWPGRGSRLFYYVEASDRVEAVPARSGSERSPFVVRFDRPIPRSQRPVETPPSWTPSVLGFGGILLVAWALPFLGRRRREKAFWVEILGPLSHLRGEALHAALAETCSRRHYDPRVGDVRVELDQALGKLAELRRTDPEALARARDPQAEGHAEAPAGSAARRTSAPDPGEELFWFTLLAPLVGLPRAQSEAGLRALTGRPLVSPVCGKRYYDLQTLRRRLSWVRSSDPAAILGRPDPVRLSAAVPLAGRPGPTKGEEAPRMNENRAGRLRRSAGTTLIEMIVVVAILGAAMLISALYLLPAAQPLTTAGDLLEDLMKQTRAKAMATTTVHRVRPIDDEELVVEASDSCTSGAWTLDPRMELRLPEGVSMTETAWSVCFNTRGIASDNLVVTLQHAQLPSRQLEVLKGGLVRWLP